VTGKRRVKAELRKIDKLESFGVFAGGITEPNKTLSQAPV